MSTLARRHHTEAQIEAKEAKKAEVPKGLKGATAARGIGDDEMKIRIETRRKIRWMMRMMRGDGI